MAIGGAGPLPYGWLDDHLKGLSSCVMESNPKFGRSKKFIF